MSYIVLARCPDCNAIIARGTAESRTLPPKFAEIKPECLHTRWIAGGCFFEWIPVARPISIKREDGKVYCERADCPGVKI